MNMCIKNHWNNFSQLFYNIFTQGFISGRTETYKYNYQSFSFLD